MPKARPVTIRYADGTSKTVRDSEISRGKRRRELDHWRQIRRKALERDGHRCAVCRRKRGDEDPRLKGGRRTRLEVHHRTYVRYGREWLEDLVTLCVRCHATEHQWLKRGVGRQV